MVVVHRAFGFRIVIHTQDHEPAHVHIVGSGRAKINLLGATGRPEVVSIVGIKKSDVRNLLAEVTEHRDRFIQEWERIHGRSE